MAKQNFNQLPREGGSGGGIIVVEDTAHRDRGNGGDGTDRPHGSVASQPPTAGRGFFDIYKPGQGYYTRVYSGVAGGALVAWGAAWLYEKLALIDAGDSTKIIQVGGAVAMILGFGLLGYWMLALNKKVCDFLIATEGEMKKVNWTSRKEIIGSTKVVIFLVVAVSIMLFVVDMCFMTFFNLIGILKGTSAIDILKELF